MEKQMRNAVPRILYTFRTTTDAMRMEKLARAAALPGRLVPVPGSVRAGCGLAWAVPPGEKTAVRVFLGRVSLVPDGEWEVLL